MLTPAESERLITESFLPLRLRSPFFATLGLFTGWRIDHSIATVATNGFDVFYNPEFLKDLPRPQRSAVLLHQVLHAAFLHLRAGVPREQASWNLACDFVINGFLAKQGYLMLLPKAPREEALETRPVEEVYELILQHREKYQDRLLQCCLLPEYRLREDKASLTVLQRNTEYQTYWGLALRQAKIVQTLQSGGSMPLGLPLILRYLEEAQVDWRTALWRFVVKTPADFGAFDRRLVHQGLYLEESQIDSVCLYLCIDAGCFLNEAQRRTFLQEVHNILRAYPHLQGKLFVSDEGLYGPYELPSPETFTMPRTRGNSSYAPLFAQIEKERLPDSKVVCVYLTDGLGEFPSIIPDVPVLWLVTPGGLETEQFPFGEPIRFLQT